MTSKNETGGGPQVSSASSAALNRRAWERSSSGTEGRLVESTLLPLLGASVAESTVSASRRISSTQLAVIRDNLGSTALFALQTLRSYRLMQAQHLARILSFDGDSEAARRSCRRLLKRLFEQDLVRRLDRRIGGVRAGSSGYVYAVSPLGHRLLGSPKRKRWAEPSLYFVNHTLAIAELASQLTATCSFDRLGEVIETEPEVWRTYDTGMGTQTLKPDLFAMIRSASGDELHWFIEVDLHTESLGRIRRKCQAYVDYFQSGTEQRERSIFPRVLWIVPTAQRAEQLTRVLGQGRWPPGLFALALTKQATFALTSFD